MNYHNALLHHRSINYHKNIQDSKISSNAINNDKTKKNLLSNPRKLIL